MVERILIPAYKLQLVVIPLA